MSALEFAITELMQVPAPTQYERHVNQQQLHNVITTLKTKCGVKFEVSDEDNTFRQRLKLDRVHMQHTNLRSEEQADE